MRAFVAGGAGFIGSHTVRRLLEQPDVERVTVYDNLSSGKVEYLPRPADRRLRFVHAEVGELDRLSEAMAGSDVIFHYASNPDIARAVTEPAIDFHQGTVLTQNVLEAMRRTGVREIIYASGSGVYGDTGLTEVHEDYAPLLPISTYGASKLAGEALICAYCHMFDLRGWVFRFANVVGPRQTHGVAFDFLRRLVADPKRLRILGDGRQSKSYIHVDDVLDGIWLAWRASAAPYNYFNLATRDSITVNEIADMVIGLLNLTGVEKEFTGGDRGWKGDVPVVRISIRKMEALGWQPRFTSAEAVTMAAAAMLAELREPVAQ